MPLFFLPSPFSNLLLAVFDWSRAILTQWEINGSGNRANYGVQMNEWEKGGLRVMDQGCRGVGKGKAMERE